MVRINRAAARRLTPHRRHPDLIAYDSLLGDRKGVHQRVETLWRLSARTLDLPAQGPQFSHPARPASHRPAPGMPGKRRSTHLAPYIVPLRCAVQQTEPVRATARVSRAGPRGSSYCGTRHRPAPLPHRPDAGAQAVASTLARGNVTGMISVHYRQPTTWSELQQQQLAAVSAAAWASAAGTCIQRPTAPLSLSRSWHRPRRQGGPCPRPTGIRHPRTKSASPAAPSRPEAKQLTLRPHMSCSGRPCRYSAWSAGQNGSPSPGGGRADSSPAIRRPGPVGRISAPSARVNRELAGGPVSAANAKSWPKSG